MKTKTVVITGSARGLGYEMAKCFRKKNYNVVISDLNKKDIDRAKSEILNIKGKGGVLALVCDITQDKDIINLISKSISKFKCIDIWINNAGVNQPDKMIWELSSDEIRRMVEIDLTSTMVASRYIMEEMIKVNHGAIYMVEGHGSNNAIVPGLSIYGTAKRGITYFSRALAKEAEVNKNDIVVGRLAPGIMITDFLVNAFRDKKMNLSEKNKRIYNILGDYPDVVAKYLVNRMIDNTSNDVRINWLTNRKVIWKFITYSFKKNKKLK